MNDNRISLTLLGIVLLFTAVIFYARHVSLARQGEQSQVPVIAHYTNYAYRVNLRYPPEWQPVGGYAYDRYEGNDGFFGISAGGTGNVAMADMVKSEVDHPLKPYGKEPSIQDLLIDGQKAKLIMPSADQDASMRGQAVLIVTYPLPLTIGTETYKYFVFWADRAHIQDIASSITFINQ
ncbi:peptidase M56 [Candidatus Parcubacteria bacterium]|nr:peptidase M56 [Candidatus Parcubacteria bacterium]